MGFFEDLRLFFINVYKVYTTVLTVEAPTAGPLEIFTTIIKIRTVVL